VIRIIQNFDLKLNSIFSIHEEVSFILSLPFYFYIKLSHWNDENDQLIKYIRDCIDNLNMNTL